MKNLLVKTKNLVAGCILSKDISGLTSYPLMNKKTILTEDLLEVLKAFFITEVSVEKTLVDGTKFTPREIIDDEGEGAQENSSFIADYLKAVQSYKRQFQNWQAGSAVDVAKIREIMIPLFERSLEKPLEIFSLHHYSNKEDYLYHHTVSIGLLSGYLAKKMDYDVADVYQIILAGSLADCGMAKIPPEILGKSTSLTALEYEEVRKHPIYSLRMLQRSTILKESVKYAILQHHERLDGSGYPRGKSERTPHAFAKIVAVADAYHAMTSERAYRKKQSPFKVMEMIMQDDFGKFDITVINILLSCIMNYSMGSRVRLSNGYIAEIVFIDKQSPTRPLIKVIDTGEMIHLNNYRDLFIEEVL
ncbi:HD-GYP domain-containing protein [Peribacillus huizhouensis]|uniref:HD-GYP domain-containing protein n=1 Tax=Peribacillus huizhouensis TaxID=1501239 RepID=UPI0028AD546A|nr:HD-GYP domain-containing protein [Peribacillus huizhouensis]